MRSKIFLLLSGTLLVIAVLIIVLSRYEVTESLSSAERHAMRNVMTLAERNINSRWESSLDSKIAIVRNERDYLMQTGELILSSLRLSGRSADARGAEWINRIPAERHPNRHFFAYDAQFRITASNLPGWVGRDISELRNFKGQPLAQSMYDESRRFRYGFSMYHAGDDKDGPAHGYYGYFVYFEDWDWVIVIAENSETIAEQIASQKAQMENELQASLSTMRLARSGFMFIVADDGRFIAPPPESSVRFVNPDFLTRLREGPAAARKRENREKTGGNGEGSSLSLNFGGGFWHVEAYYFKPLGWTLTAMVPESDLVFPATQLVERQIIIFTMILLFAWVCASFIIARIVSPLSLLARFVRRLPEQDWTAEKGELPAAIAALPKRFHDEIGQLAEAFLLMDAKLRENIAQLVRETSLRGRIERELSIARDIQLGLLPQPLAAEVRAFISLAATMNASKEVGGDLYDYFLLPDKLCLVIGDVSGKGVPAALFMAITRTLVRATAEAESDPARLLEIVNNHIAQNNPNLIFVTLLVGMLQLETREFTWANAGHPPPLRVAADGAVDPLQGRSGPACGVVENARYASFSHRFSVGEALVAYTDGVTEANDVFGAQYGEARLKATVAKAEKIDADILVSAIVADVGTFAAGTEQFDDITLLALRFRR